MKYLFFILIFIFINTITASKEKDKVITLRGKEAEEYIKYFRGGQHFVCPGKHEIWSHCPPLCTPTCHNPSPNCTMHLNKKFHSKCPPSQCICEAGFIRNCDYECIPTKNCKNSTHTQICNKNIITSKLDFLEKEKCHPHEIFKKCSSNCEPSCDNRNPRCNKKCGKPKCECRPDFYRNHMNVCVPLHNCPHNVTYISKISYSPKYIETIQIMNDGVNGTCNENEVWSECSSSCEPTCGVTRTICPMNCGPPKCQCNVGFSRYMGRCIRSDRCPSISTETIFSEPSEKYYKKFTIISEMRKRCGINEQFVQCSSNCEPTCFEKKKKCNRACGPPTCQCKKGYFRNGGMCISENECKTTFQVTENYLIRGQCRRNEEFVTCSSLCEPTCGESNQKPCLLKCGEPKCQCKKGYSRINGICIETDKCFDRKFIEYEMKIFAYEFGFLNLISKRNSCKIPEILEKCLEKPINYSCPENEEFKCCGPFQEETCASNLLKKKVKNSCGPSKCVCKEKFYRNSFGKCISVKDCKKELKRVSKNILKHLKKRQMISR
uniref:TIL domain-containing protein n=1 Tax=Strongyloides stercoralis TaxID=6248 RepID=A0A0K0DV06_STRER